MNFSDSLEEVNMQGPESGDDDMNFWEKLAVKLVEKALVKKEKFMSANWLVKKLEKQANIAEELGLESAEELREKVAMRQNINNKVKQINRDNKNEKIARSYKNLAVKERANQIKADKRAVRKSKPLQRTLSVNTQEHVLNVEAKMRDGTVNIMAQRQRDILVAALSDYGVPEDQFQPLWQMYINEGKDAVRAFVTENYNGEVAPQPMQIEQRDDDEVEYE